MSDDRILESVAREYHDFRLDDTEEVEQGASDKNYCEYARQFHHWGHQLVEGYVHPNATPLQLAQAKVMLLDSYFERLVSVPKSHRNRIGERGHVCLHQVLVDLYQHVRGVQLRILPVQIFNPPAPAPPPQPPALLGITLGEVLGEE